MKSYLIAITALLGISALHGMDPSKATTCKAAAKLHKAAIEGDVTNRSDIVQFLQDRIRVEFLTRQSPWDKLTQCLIDAELDLLEPSPHDPLSVTLPLDRFHTNYSRTLAALARDNNLALAETMEDRAVGQYLDLSSRLSTSVLSKMNKTHHRETGVKKSLSSPLRRS